MKSIAAIFLMTVAAAYSWPDFSKGKLHVSDLRVTNGLVQLFYYCPTQAVCTIQWSTNLKVWQNQTNVIISPITNKSDTEVEGYVGVFDYVPSKFYRVVATNN